MPHLQRSSTKQQQRHWQHEALTFKSCCAAHAGTGQAAAGSRAGPPDHAAAAAGRQPWHPAVLSGCWSAVQPCVCVPQPGRSEFTGWAWRQPPGAGHSRWKPSIPVWHSYRPEAQQQSPRAGGCLAWAAFQAGRPPSAWCCSIGHGRACAQPGGRLCQRTGSSTWGGRPQQQHVRAQVSAPGGRPWGRRDWSGIGEQHPSAAAAVV